MFKFKLKKEKAFLKDNTPDSTHPDQQVTNAEATQKSLLTKFKHGLKKTGRQLSGGLTKLFTGKKTIDREWLEVLETQLLLADTGVETTQSIITDLTERLNRRQLQDSNALHQALRENCRRLLQDGAAPLTFSNQPMPFVLMVVGINGAGKTTTIGKLTQQLQQQGLKVMLAAGDTFRAAAIEQLQAWGQRNRTPVIAQQPGADSASVAYDAYQAAKARQIDVLIVDTAGRLHTQQNLMNELQKVQRVLGKIDATAPHETMLVLDASTGQNALRQAQQFHKAVHINGITLTKLDGTAKGGIVFALSQAMAIPIRYLGTGEDLDDLNLFEPDLFVDALLSHTELSEHQKTHTEDH